MKIKEFSHCDTGFTFIYTTLDDVVDEIARVNIATACPKDNVPSNMLKDFWDIFSLNIFNDFNNSINNAIFPGNLIQADGNRPDKTNYRPDESTFVCI